MPRSLSRFNVIPQGKGETTGTQKSRRPRATLLLRADTIPTRVDSEIKFQTAKVVVVRFAQANLEGLLELLFLTYYKFYRRNG